MFHQIFPKFLPWKHVSHRESPHIFIWFLWWVLKKLSSLVMLQMFSLTAFVLILYFYILIFTITRGPCPLLALLVKPRSQGLSPLQPVLAKSHLFLANIKQILMRFVYMSDQGKKWELQTFIWVLFHYTGPKLPKWTLL